MSGDGPRAALAPAGARRRLYWRFGAGTVVTVLLIGLLLALADWDSVLAAAATLSPVDLVAVTVLMALTHFARALRLGLMLQAPLPRRFPALLRVTVLHNFFSMYAPMRLGDFALVWLVRRDFGFALAAGFGVFLVVRLLDLVFLLSSAGLAAWFVIPAGSRFAWLGLLGPAGVAGMALVLLAWGAGLGRRLERLAGRWAAARGRLLPTLAGVIGVVTRMNAGQLLGLVLVTALCWSCIFAAAYAAVAAVLPEANLPLAVWAADGGGLSFLLPVAGVANVGTYEATTVAALALAAVSYNDALLLAVLLHAAILLAPILLMPLTLLGGGRLPIARPTR